MLSRLNANGVLDSDFKFSKALQVTEVIFYVFEEYTDDFKLHLNVRHNIWSLNKDKKA